MEEYCKILIVDDEFIMRQGMTHMLDWEKEGFQIVGEASDGQEGLKLVEKLKPHIVLADIVMPVVDGLEFTAIMQAQHPEIQVIILSSYDKFEYVKTALMSGAADYILKPTLSAESLLNTLKQVSRNISGICRKKEGEISCETQMARFISGYQDRIDEVDFALRFPHSLYRVMGVNLKVLCRERKERMESVRVKLEEDLEKQREFEFLSVVFDEEYLCVIFNYRVKDDEAVIRYTMEYAEHMKRKYEDFFLVLSRSCANMQDLRSAFQNGVREMLTRRFYLPNRCVVVLEKDLVRKNAERFNFEQYTRCLGSGEMHEAINMFLAYIEDICRIQEDEYKVRNLTKNLLFNYLVELERYGVSGETLRRQYFQEIDDAENVETFLDVVYRFVRDQRAQTYMLKKEDVQIAEMKRYIRNHYKEPLELTDLAEQFGFSYNYISSYFKGYMPEGFSGYLNKIRIEAACGLLQNTSRSIAEIGSEAGYADQSYFCRVFKKYTGMTPSAWRRRKGRR